MQKKSCAVLDLDSTLIHTFGSFQTWQYVEKEPSERIRKRLFDIKTCGEFMWGTKRPYTSEFLQSCFETFDIVGVWSAGMKDYVHEIVAEIFTGAGIRCPDFIWSRKDCEDYFNEQTCSIVKQKPLSKLYSHFPELDNKRTLIFDDYTDVCWQDTMYHVHVPAWRGNFDTLTKADIHLKSLSKWIREDLPSSTDYKTVSLKGILE